MKTKPHIKSKKKDKQDIQMIKSKSDISPKRETNKILK